MMFWAKVKMAVATMALLVTVGAAAPVACLAAADGVEETPKKKWKHLALEVVAQMPKPGEIAKGSRILYVDNTLKVDINDGSYDKQKRSGGGKDGNAYVTIKAALADMKTGDTILLRGGTYRESTITLPDTINGTSWKPGEYNTIMSYPREWAILDGANNLQGSHKNPKHKFVIGLHYPQLHYWRLERLEVCNGTDEARAGASGISMSGGPFIVRHCYIHDNIATNGNGSNLPAGLSGYTWSDSLIELCHFSNNGHSSADGSNNVAHIRIMSDYKFKEIHANGFRDMGIGKHIMRNTIRHNLFTDVKTSSMAIFYKAGQLLTGRAKEQDEYTGQGDDIHHNILIGLAGWYSIYPRQDYVQVHHNIVAGSRGLAMTIGWGDGSVHKSLVYNNTVLDGGGILWFHTAYHRKNYQLPVFLVYHNWAFNNIASNCTDGWLSKSMGVFSPKEFEDADLSAFVFDRNYYHNPKGNEVFTLGNGPKSHYTVKRFLETFKGREIWANKEDPANPLFKGTEGADRFIPRGKHKIGDGKTVADAGIGGDHPYLEGIKLPKYLGAVNPDDSAWVGGVLGLKSVENLKNAPVGNPEWIEK